MQLKIFPAQISISMAIACAIVVPCAGCGAPDSIASSSTPGAAITSITVSCSPAGVVTGGSTQCTATVQGTGNYSSGVKWSASSGVISPSGVFTAPSTAGTVTVTAASNQEPSLTGTANVTVASAATPSSIKSISVSCRSTTVSTGGTSQCNASVQGAGSYSSAVKWSVSDGAINSAGLFTAPAVAGNVTVTATSSQDASISGKSTVAVQLAVPSTRHIVLVMEENQSYSTVVGQTSVWPNLNNLITDGALPTNYYANVHPSIGNYLMLTTGQVLTTNDNSTQVWNVDNLARRMLAAKVSFRIYAEGISRGYVGGNTGAYLIRHDPFALLSDIANDATVADAVIWPFSQFAADLANGTLPEFSYIVPDVNDDAHNGTPQQADSWLESNVVSPLRKNSAFQSGGDGLLIVDFDEAADSDTTHGGGHVSPVFWGPIVKAGYRQESGTVYQHQSMLRTIMEALGLSNPPAAAAGAPSMSEFFVQK